MQQIQRFWHSSRLLQKIFYLLFPVLIVLIGFNGFLMPHQYRVFGDTYPVQLSAGAGSFQFFGVDFSAKLSPSYLAPFRYQIDWLRFHMSKTYSPQVVQWYTIFLPFLLSVYLSYFFFKQRAARPWQGLLVWALYTFSTFVLFTSSIHTNIVTAINVFLFYLYLFGNFSSFAKRKSLVVLYIFASSLVLIASLCFEMRMVIVTLPFFLAQFILLAIDYYRSTSSIAGNKTGIFLVSHGIIFLLVVLNFLFLLSNFSQISADIGGLLSRSTWGNNYFSIVNTLALFHPFWNNHTPVNFVYNFPDAIHAINIFLLAVLLWVLFRAKRQGKMLVFLGVLLFFLLLSKENNPPFTNIFDWLYQFPYFNFSREASKYFYGYALALCSLVLGAFALVRNTSRFTVIFIVVLILIPTMADFVIFSTRGYGKTLTEYSSNLQVYKDINDYVAYSHPYVRVLWLPYASTLQNNTAAVQNLSFLNIVDMFPSGTVRKASHSFLYEALQDSDMKNYIRMLGVTYVVIPNLGNEPEMNSELNITYSNFNIDQFVHYAEDSLQLNLATSINGYRIYTFKQSYQPPASVAATDVNPQFLPSTQLALEDGSGRLNQPIMESIPTSAVEHTLGNCNKNAQQHLDFKPADRIDYLESSKNTFQFGMQAGFDEVPCIFFTFNKPLNQDVVMDIQNYQGAPVEALIFPASFPVTPLPKKILEIDSHSTGLIPLNCDSAKCVVGFYLYGTNHSQRIQNSLSGEFLSEASSITQDTHKIIYWNNAHLNSLQGTPITLSIDARNADYIAFPYPYDPQYRLHIHGNSIAPVPNSLHILIFGTAPFKQLLTPGQLPAATLVYEPEQDILLGLRFSWYILFFVFAGLFISLGWLSLEVWRERSRKIVIKTHDSLWEKSR
jgi:hypothetical protein